MGAIPLRSLTTGAIKDAYQDLHESGLSRKTVHNIHLVLRRALGDAVERGYVQRNPAERAHKLPTQQSEMKVWDANQLQRFLEEASTQRLFAFWRLAAMTGARRGELLGLRWKDIDLDAGTVSITRQRVRGPSGVTWGSPKTERGRRTLDIDPGTVVILREWRRRQLEERLAWGEAYDDHGLVACRENGSPSDPDVASQSFIRLSKSAGLPRIRFHDLRHTHATLLLKEGVAAHVVSQRLGHASVGFTLQTYAHVLPQQQAEAVARLASAIGG